MPSFLKKFGFSHGPRSPKHHTAPKVKTLEQMEEEGSEDTSGLLPSDGSKSILREQEDVALGDGRKMPQLLRPKRKPRGPPSDSTSPLSTSSISSTTSSLQVVAVTETAGASDEELPIVPVASHPTLFFGAKGDGSARNLNISDFAATSTGQDTAVSPYGASTPARAPTGPGRAARVAAAAAAAAQLPAAEKPTCCGNNKICITVGALVFLDLCLFLVIGWSKFSPWLNPVIEDVAKVLGHPSPASEPLTRSSIATVHAETPQVAVQSTAAKVLKKTSSGGQLKKTSSGGQGDAAKRQEEDWPRDGMEHGDMGSVVLFQTERASESGLSRREAVRFSPRLEVSFPELQPEEGASDMGTSCAPQASLDLGCEDCDLEACQALCARTPSCAFVAFAQAGESPRCRVFSGGLRGEPACHFGGGGGDGGGRLVESKVYRKAASVSSASASVGARVQRGKDWKEVYGDQDGGVGKGGTITKVLAMGKDLCQVRWDAGQEGIYRTGEEDRFELDFFFSDAEDEGGHSQPPLLDIGAGTIEAQEIEGFGGALTNSTATAFQDLTPKLKRELIEKYFGRDGLRFTIGRDLVEAGRVGDGEKAGRPAVDSIPKSEQAAEVKNWLDGLEAADGDKSTRGPGEKPDWEEAEDLARSILQRLGLTSEAWIDRDLLSKHGAKTSNSTEHDEGGYGAGVRITAGLLEERSQYFALGHFSRFVSPGSKRLQAPLIHRAATVHAGAHRSEKDDSDGASRKAVERRLLLRKGHPAHRNHGGPDVDGPCRGLQTASFLRPDGLAVVVALNYADEAAFFELRDGLRALRAQIPPRAIQTYLFEFSPHSDGATSAAP